jgi:predicted nucleic acid-binding protein
MARSSPRGERPGATESRRRSAETTVVPVTDALITAVAEMRAACRQVGHPLADRIHANDLWIAASAVHIAAALVTADTIFEGAPGLVLAQ